MCAMTGGPGAVFGAEGQNVDRCCGFDRRSSRWSSQAACCFGFRCGYRPGGAEPSSAARWIGLPVLIVGVAGLLWCIWDFGRRGKGTLAPIDPPRFVVRTGPYRVVRNPMYLSVLTALGGEALLFSSSWLIVWAVVVATAFHVFVIAYEEPALRRQFGPPYEGYCRAVSRWLPRRPSS